MEDNEDSVYVVGHWELGWNSPIKELDLWEYPLKEFGVKQLAMVPISGLSTPGQNLFLKEFLNTEEAVTQYESNHTVVVVDENGSSDLESFVHPQKAVYVFGKTSLSPLLLLQNKNNIQSIRIKTTNNTGMLWAHQAATVVLYDRMKKKP